MFLATQGRTHSNSGCRSQFPVLRSRPQGYRVFSFFKLCLPYTQVFLSCKPIWFYPPRTGLSLSDLSPPSSLLNTDLPCSGQLFWSPVPPSIPLSIAPTSSSFSYPLFALISLPLYAFLSFCFLHFYQLL